MKGQKMDKKYYKNSPDNIIKNDETSSILKKSNAIEFHRSLPEYKATPLTHLPGLAKKYGVGNIYLKDESYRFGLNAFKGLGASYAVYKVLEKDPDIETICTATDGNHGRAVAWSAKNLGKRSVVYVPSDTTKKRIEAIEAEGAKVIQINGDYDEACETAKIRSQENDWALVQDTAWEGYTETPALIMAGYLTMFKEIENSFEGKNDIDIVFLQAGVGSFAGSGVYYYLSKYSKKRPKIVIVEPEEADGILLTFKNNKISTSQGSGVTIMAGLNCATPSMGAWNILKSGTDLSLKVNDDYTRKAIRELYYPNGRDKRIISGESGAAGLAGFLALMNEAELKEMKDNLNINENSNILFISTEGDTDKLVFAGIVEDPNYE